MRWKIDLYIWIYCFLTIGYGLDLNFDEDFKKVFINSEANSSDFEVSFHSRWMKSQLNLPSPREHFKYASKIDDHPESLTIRQLRCSNYPYTHIPFIFLNKSYCKPKNETSEKTLHAQPPQESFFQRHWLLLFVIFVFLGGIGGAGVHFYRNRAFASPFQRRQRNPEEEEKLEEDFDSSNV